MDVHSIAFMLKNTLSCLLGNCKVNTWIIFDYERRFNTFLIDL